MPSTPSTKSLFRRVLGRIFSRRTLSALAFTVAVLATAVVGYYAIEKMCGRALWRSYEATAQQRGVKLALTDYVPAPIPDAQNFAAIPIFDEVFRAAREQRTVPNPFAIAGAEPPRQTPDPIYPLKGKTLDLAAWQQSFLKTKVLAAATEDPARDVLKALEIYGPALQQLHEAGQRPASRFPVRWEDGVSTALPHLGVIQSACRLYGLRLGAHLAIGDSPAAYEDFRDGLRLYTALQNEPSLISGLVRISLLTILENAVWDGLMKRQWQDAELRRIAEDLEPLRLFADYRLAMGSERGFNNLIHQQIRELSGEKTREMSAMINALSSTDNPRPQWVAGLLPWYPRGWIYRSQERANRYFDEMLERVSPEPPRVFPERATEFRPVMAKGTFERLRYFFFNLLAPALDDMEQTYARSQTWLDQTRLGCALERYRLAQGHFPASLDALAPAYMASLPRDVVNGEPLHYRVEPDGGYVVYSVAYDLKDDGGKIDPKVGAKKQADWVWSMR